MFPRLRLAVFVDGCFWHGCPKHFKLPASNHDFWQKKFEANRLRDRLVNRTLRAKGWRVLRIWEHELVRKNEKRLHRRIRYALEAAAQATK
ncbi:DNA mismatch repair protein Vsr [candidate division BRC1 bacterium HGW-BRC1-1]|nr:MAG: DNA mismatch repair protein Vsr [candidate division BRC1 bacterium HGW-BRC1-1]